MALLYLFFSKIANLILLYPAFGMRYSAEAIMKHEFRPEEITIKDVTVVVKIFLDAVTADGKPQYPPEILMTQRSELAQWWADKLEGIV